MTSKRTVNEMNATIRTNGVVIRVHGEAVPFKGIFFSGGEPHVEIESPDMLLSKRVLIDARLGNAEDFMMMLAVTDAVKRCRAASVMLFVPYFPGARQDREETGYALTVKMYADLINVQKYERVFVLDPHSPVTPALVERVVILDHIPLVKNFLEEVGVHLTGIICPDAGAERRTLELAKEIGCDNVVFARKKRDPRTGSLSGFSLDELPEEGTYLVADDLCDGGGTFLGLAAEYRKDPKGTGSLLLWVTHGIFSKGMDGLAKAFDHVGCSSSFPAREGTHPQLHRAEAIFRDLFPAGRK
jgi:ribose-phosphate pyrophosphokinase